jgi:uncharacterized protein YjbI with pentapeptide repeats
MHRPSREEIQERFRKHSLWLAGEEGGERFSACCTDLTGVDLIDAVLRDAYLRRAYLSGANFRGADLSDANLRGADLSGANLRGVDLTGTDLRHTVLTDADLTDVKGLPALASPGLAARVLAQIKAHPETHDQSEWHSDCGTKHCVAGWACVLAEVPADIEACLGTAHAARLALGLDLSAECPFEPNDDPKPWLRGLCE